MKLQESVLPLFCAGLVAYEVLQQVIPSHATLGGADSPQNAGPWLAVAGSGVGLQVPGRLFSSASYWPDFQVATTCVCAVHNVARGSDNETDGGPAASQTIWTRTPPYG